MVTLLGILIAYGIQSVGQLRTVLGLCRIRSLVVEAQQEVPYAFSRRIYCAIMQYYVC